LHIIFKNPSFIKLLAFRIQMVLAYQMMAVVVGWHIYEITQDPLSLGLVGLAEVIPYFSSALFAGYAVDHHGSRRMFAVLAGLMLFLNASTLMAVSAGWLGSNASDWIYISIAFTGLARAFIAPSYNALFAIVIPRENYGKAASLASSVFQTGLVVGPALGGLVVGWLDKTVAYALASVFSMGAAIAMISLRVQEPEKLPSAPMFASIAEGLRFVYGKQIIFAAQCLDMFAVLFGGTVAMLPAFMQEVYHYGPEGLGIMRAAPAVGAIVIGLVLAKHPINLHAGRWLLCSVAGFGLCIIGFALSASFWLAAVFLLLSGLFDGVSVVLRTTILQLATPDHMRGRVSAINGIFIGSSNELGAFESGISAKLMGLIPSVIFGASMTLIVVAATAKLAPQLRKLELNQLH
jgi:MFS family permease